MDNHKGGMSRHTSPKMNKDEWLTPPFILEALGEFDLDPCSSINRPWDTAKNHFTINDNGLLRDWNGRVWLNPPYGKHTNIWMDKLVLHGNGIALIFARTETAVWFSSIWPLADAVFFFKGRLHFHHIDGSRSPFNAGAPSALIAYGKQNVRTLEDIEIPGKFIRLK